MANSISDFFGSNNAGFGDVNIDAVIAGNNNQINKYLQLPTQTDPLPAALARLATLPLCDVRSRKKLLYGANTGWSLLFHQQYPTRYCGTVTSRGKPEDNVSTTDWSGQGL